LCVTSHMYVNKWFGGYCVSTNEYVCHICVSRRICMSTNDLVATVCRQMSTFVTFVCHVAYACQQIIWRLLASASIGIERFTFWDIEAQTTKILNLRNYKRYKLNKTLKTRYRSLVTMIYTSHEPRKWVTHMCVCMCVKSRFCTSAALIENPKSENHPIFPTKLTSLCVSTNERVCLFVERVCLFVTHVVWQVRNYLPLTYVTKALSWWLICSHSYVLICWLNCSHSYVLICLFICAYMWVTVDICEWQR